MNREQLFTNLLEPTPEMAETGEFDRSPLEGYVTGEMAADLLAIDAKRIAYEQLVQAGTPEADLPDPDPIKIAYEQLAEKQAGILEAAAPLIAANTDPYVARTTQMDMLFMFGSYIPAKEEMYDKAPVELMSQIQEQSDRFGIEPFMTYELIVDHNSQEYLRTGVMRTFTDGTVGMNERDFYLGHHLGEPFARSAAYKLHGLAEQPELVDTEAILVSAKEDLDEFKKYMGGYNRLPKDDFAAFRPYLGGYADGTRNASGAFMPSVQLLELATISPTDHYGVYLDESQRYFPTWSQPVMEEWRILSEQGVNIEGLIDSGRLELSDTAHAALVGVIDSFINFRMAHLGITKAQIPEAFSRLDSLKRKDIAAQPGEDQILHPNYKGTAGFDVRNVLTNSVYRLLKLRERIAGSAEEAAAA